ncbi:MAG: amidase family protein [Pseudomonadota bacterium]
MSELWEFNATQLTHLVSSKQVSCLEIVEAYFSRISEVNGSINAITVSLEESARETAIASDKFVAAGKLAPLTGVPISIKENQDVAGSATTLGLIPLKNAAAATDAVHIGELRSAGAIPIARTNMPEFGMRWHTSNGIYGPTLNPRNVELTPGGSSGGEAAAIASGMSPLGIGNDGAGSLRWPAQCCGISALKPSLGRIPIASNNEMPMPAAFQLLGVHGPMARHIDDLELAFRHMCSGSTSDPWHIEAPYEGKTLEAPIHIGIVNNLSASPGIAFALQKATDMLKDAGYVTKDVSLPSLDRGMEIYTQIMSSFGRLTAEPERAPVGVVSEEYDQFWAHFNEPWNEASGKKTHDPLMERAAIYHEWFEMMSETPLIVSPISIRQPWEVGADLDSTWIRGWLDDIKTVVIVNLLGLPAVSLPVIEHNGLPQVIQIIGPRFREDLCIAAAEKIERRAEYARLANP